MCTLEVYMYIVLLVWFEIHVQGYYRIVKQPMDFATMRAKLHNNMYTGMELLKVIINYILFMLLSHYNKTIL